MKRRTRNIIAVLILILSVIIIVASAYYKANYAEQTFDTIIFHLEKGLEKSNTEVVGKALQVCIIPICVLLVIFCIPMTNIGDNISTLNIRIKNKRKILQIYPNKKILKHQIAYAVIILIISALFALERIGLYKYLRSQTKVSTLFEEQYVASEDVKITFPEKKRNLIYIFLESMETTLASPENGGGWEYSIIPELEKLAMDNLNFSNTEKLGGALPIVGTVWTVAGMVAQTAATPLKVSIDGNSYSGYSSFLPGVYSLGDILQKEGYNLELMVGSDASFGGRRDYFTSHGNYKIFDLNTAIEEGKMKEEDKVWWGFDDDNLFDWAKEEILDLASQEEPFNFVMLTVDTHFMDGYLSENAGNKYDTQYENVFAYSSKSTYSFIKWLQEQDFYDNTTIVVVGDHLGMQTEFYNEHVDNNYTRTVYNTFINSAISTNNNKNRQFSTLDMFPTVLASIGAKIDGERLGLGTNLFSKEKTLIEELGYGVFNEEVGRKSDYYNEFLLQEDYIRMLKSSGF